MATDGLFYIFIQGLRFDLVILGLILVLPMVLAPLMHINTYLSRVWKPWLVFYLLLCFALFVFIEASTPSFTNQYDVQPNIWFIEYLKYSDEVFSTLYKVYKLQLVTGPVLTLTASFLLYRQLKKSLIETHTIKWYVSLLSR